MYSPPVLWTRLPPTGPSFKFLNVAIVISFATVASRIRKPFSEKCTYKLLPLMNLPTQEAAQFQFNSGIQQWQFNCRSHQGRYEITTFQCIRGNLRGYTNHVREHPQEFRLLIELFGCIQFPVETNLRYQMKLIVITIAGYIKALIR